MLMQNFGVTNKEHFCMLWYFLEWSIVKAACELSSSRVSRVSIRPVLETLKMCSNPIRIGSATNTIL